MVQSCSQQSPVLVLALVPRGVGGRRKLGFLLFAEFLERPRGPCSSSGASRERVWRERVSGYGPSRVGSSEAPGVLGKLGLEPSPEA